MMDSGVLGGLACCLLLVGCTNRTHFDSSSKLDELNCEDGVTLGFTPDAPGPDTERYRCFAYSADLLGGEPIRGLVWKEPEGDVLLHHAALRATSELRPTDGAFDCEPMPEDAVSLHIWVSGGSQLTLPPDVGIALPTGARTLIIEAHAFRLGWAPAGMASLKICRSATTPLKLAGWLGLRAPVPAIRPGTVETSTSSCLLSEPWHMLFAWPHMHLAGKEFHGALLHGTLRTPTVDIDPWDFYHQFTYPIDLSGEAGDVIETQCTWSNPTAEYVLPGIYTQNEMCTHALIGWPASAARCAYQ